MTAQITLYRKIMHFIYESITHSRIIFIVGDLGVQLNHYKKNILTDSLFCPISELSTNKLDEFVAKYNKSDAKFIINSKEINLQHESLPVVGSIGKQDPVQNYCDTHFHQTDLFTYKVHSVIKEEADIWKAAILWLPINNTLERCLNLVKDNNMDLSGFYFNPIILQYTADIIAKENNIELSDFVYIAVSVSITAGISITLNHGNNILSCITCDYPMDKSIAYIQGIIEQNVSDAWLKFKSYIEQNKLRKLNVFILTGELKDLISSQTYEVEKSIFAKTNLADQYADLVYLDYFTKVHQVSAKSRNLITYYRYLLINKIFFKGAYLLLIILSLYVLFIKKDLFDLDNNTDKVYSEYFKATKALNEIAEKFPNITNVAELADYYNAQNDLAKTHQSPFPITQDFIEIAGERIIINKISWDLDVKNEILIANIDFETVTSKSDTLNIKSYLDNIIKALKSKNPNFDIVLKTIKPKSSDNEQSKAITQRLILTEIKE